MLILSIDAAEKHDQVYNKGDNNSSVNAMGTAAAMQALKKFTSGGKEEGNGGKNDFISLAMGEASKVSLRGAIPFSPLDLTLCHDTATGKANHTTTASSSSTPSRPMAALPAALTRTRSCKRRPRSP